MKQVEFSALSTTAQADLTWDRGVFLGYREQDGTRYVLYQVDGFYVEFQYDMASNQINRQLSFDDTALLDVYFEQKNP